ncbi:MAG: GNAT family N-acetyltransferase [Clostridia bacterium]|nr:GNAT family N-acetyltransferase [Clostridia bacterium]
MELVVKHYNELTPAELYEILKVRSAVFVVEQNCVFLDMDGNDVMAYHVTLWDNGKILAYLRVLEKGVTFDEVAIGRVLTTVRGKGYANVILEAGIKTAIERYGAKRIKLEAQTYARGVYEKFGFQQSSGEFLEDGIPHIEMTLDLERK